VGRSARGLRDGHRPCRRPCGAAAAVGVGRTPALPAPALDRRGPGRDRPARSGRASIDPIGGGSAAEPRRVAVGVRHRRRPGPPAPGGAAGPRGSAHGRGRRPRHRQDPHGRPPARAALVVEPELQLALCAPTGEGRRA
jgi:hypothetical protein